MIAEKGGDGCIRCGQDIDGHSVNAINGNHSSIIRQPTADFLRLGHPLPAPPIQEYDLDQDLPVIEPDSYLYEDFNKEHELQHANAQYQQSSVVAPKRHSTTANVKAQPAFFLSPSAGAQTFVDDERDSDHSRSA